jgi:hypothetical protein
MAVSHVDVRIADTRFAIRHRDTNPKTFPTRTMTTISSAIQPELRTTAVIAIAPTIRTRCESRFDRRKGLRRMLVEDETRCY